MLTKERIKDNILITNSGCWEWQGNIGTHGYGRLGPILIHRAAYELYVGPIPKLDLVLHRCDNRKCCNPEHLFIGSHLANTLDGLEKGRIKRFQPRKLTDEQVEQIRELLAEGHLQKDIAKLFNVRQSYISRIGSCNRRYQLQGE